MPDSRIVNIALLLFEKVRLQDDLIPLNWMNAEALQPLIEVMVQKRSQFQRTLSSELFNRSRVHMADDQIQGLLPGQAQCPEVSAFWKDVPKLNVLVLQRTLLPGLHGVAVEHVGPFASIGVCLHALSIAKLRASVGQQDVDVFPKKVLTEHRLQQVNPFRHGKRGFALLVDCEEKAGTQKLEGLDEGTVAFVVIDCIHLRYEVVAVLFHVRRVVRIGAATEVLVVGAFLVSSGPLLGKFTGDLAPQIHHGDSLHLMEDIIFYIVIEGPFGNAEFRVICYDMVRRLTLLQKRADDRCDPFGLLRGEIDPLSGVSQRDFVFFLGVFGTILILVKSTAVPIGTTVTGPRRTVSSGTAERNKL